MTDDLASYRQRRNFKVSPEPPGDVIPELSTPLFVVQKHDASRLHYDFRMEIDGVLKSWAVPKGLPQNPSERRLAVETEDHPIGYALFEGVIPAGEYGAGTVMVWDMGTYENQCRTRNRKPQSIEAGYRQGHLSFKLHGKKLEGEFALIKRSHSPTSRQWLLIRKKDQPDLPNLERMNTSVLSGRRMEDIKKNASEKGEEA